MIIQNLKAMNVNNRVLKILIFILLSFFYYSCKNKNNKEEKNTYQILSLLTNEFTSYTEKIIFTLPPAPNGVKTNYNFSKKDSLFLYRRFYEETIKQKVIAIEPKMFEINKNYNFKEDCNTNEKLLQNFNKLNESKNININKIDFYGNNSLVYYTDKNKQTKGFDEIDIYLNYSRICFSKNYEKAILIVGVSFAKLNGFSTLYFLEKINEKWYIKCEKGLTIS